PPALPSFPTRRSSDLFDKLAAVLTPHMRQFLDQLPRVITTKADPMRRHENPRQQQLVARALEATLHLRQAQLTYHSKSSDRTKRSEEHTSELQSLAYL